MDSRPRGRRRCVLKVAGVWAGLPDPRGWSSCVDSRLGLGPWWGKGVTQCVGSPSHNRTELRGFGEPEPHSLPQAPPSPHRQSRASHRLQRPGSWARCDRPGGLCRLEVFTLHWRDLAAGSPVALRAPLGGRCHGQKSVVPGAGLHRSLGRRSQEKRNSSPRERHVLHVFPQALGSALLLSPQAPGQGASQRCLFC